MIENRLLMPGNVLNRQHPLNRGLVGEWTTLPNRIGGGGNKIRDTTGRNVGTFANGSAWSGEIGKRGGFGSTLFSSATHEIRMSHATALNPYPMSLCAWILGDTHTAYSGNDMICKGANFYTGYGLRGDQSAPQKVYASYGDGSGSRYITSQAGLGMGALSTTVWHHFAMTVDGSGMDVYYDGLFVRSASWVGTPTAYSGSADLIVAGMKIKTNIDEICLYNRKLSAAEMWSLYLEQLNGNPRRWNWISTARQSTQAASAATPWLYALRQSLIIGGGLR